DGVPPQQQLGLVAGRQRGGGYHLGDERHHGRRVEVVVQRVEEALLERVGLVRGARRGIRRPPRDEAPPARERALRRAERVQREVHLCAVARLEEQQPRRERLGVALRGEVAQVVEVLRALGHLPA